MILPNLLMFQTDVNINLRIVSGRGEKTYFDRNKENHIGLKMV